MNSDKDLPFYYYGTHYSTAFYVAYFMIRIEPFSTIAT